MKRPYDENRVHDVATALHISADVCAASFARLSVDGTLTSLPAAQTVLGDTELARCIATVRPRLESIADTLSEAGALPGDALVDRLETYHDAYVAATRRADESKEDR